MMADRGIFMKKHKVKIPERLPAVDTVRCKKCTICIEACPARAIQSPVNSSCSKCIKYCLTMDVPCNPDYLVFDYERCDGCGICLVSCPHQAIRWVTPKNME